MTTTATSAKTSIQAAGNQAVQRFITGHRRPRLPPIGPPGDHYEREAESIAKRASSAPSSYGERQSAANTGAKRSHSERPAPLFGGGMPLPAADRRFFEPRLGHNLDGVRVHTGEGAASLARSIGAEAFAYGDHVHFGSGRFAPSTIEGRSLLAHELTHVIQQREGAPPAIRRYEWMANPAQLINKYTSWYGNLDEKALGERLFSLAWMSPDHYTFVVQVIDALSWGDRDDVAQAFGEASREENLDEFAKTPEGRAMLERLENELIGGISTPSEKGQAIRFRQARARYAAAQTGLTRGKELIEAAYKAPLPVTLAGQQPVERLSGQQVLERLRLIEAVLTRVLQKHNNRADVMVAVAYARGHVDDTRTAASTTESETISRRVATSQTVVERIASLLPKLDFQIEQYRTSQGATGPALADLVQTVRRYYVDALALVGSDAAGEAFNRAEQAAARLPRAITEIDLAMLEGRAPTFSLVEPSRTEIVDWVGRIRQQIDAFEADAKALDAARTAGASDIAEREQRLIRQSQLLELSYEALQHWDQAIRAFEYLAGGGVLDPNVYSAVGRITGRCRAMRDAAYAGDIETLRQRVTAHRNDPAVADFYKALPIIVAVSNYISSLGVTLVAALVTGGVGGYARLAFASARVSTGVAVAGTLAIEALTFTTATHVLGAVVPGASAGDNFLVDLIWNFGLFAALRGLSHGVRSALTARGLQILERPVGAVASFGLLQGYGILRFTVEEGRLPTAEEIDKMTADNIVMMMGISVGTSRMQRIIEARARLRQLRTFQRQYGWRFQEFEAGRQRLIEELRALIAGGQAADPARIAELRQRAETVDRFFRDLVNEVRNDPKISLARARAELASIGLELESASSELLAASLGLPEQVGLQRGGGLEQYTFAFGRSAELTTGLQTLGASQITEEVDPASGLRTITAEFPNRPPIYLVERPATLLLPPISATTEGQIASLIADSNPAFRLSRINALTALEGFPGFTVEIAGPGGAGSDITFRRGQVVFRREVKCIAGGAQGSFNREVAHAAEQLGYNGDILVQMPAGSDALRTVLRFRGSRPTPADLGVYRSVRVTIVDPAGIVLWEGNLVD